jgi:hypothetical protein
MKAVIFFARALRRSAASVQLLDSGVCGAAILTIGIGARQSFAIFQKPIAVDFEVGRELWSFVNALAIPLKGAFSPFSATSPNRFGTARTFGSEGRGGIASCGPSCSTRREQHAFCESNRYFTGNCGSV